jgi:nitrogen fixation NifU-like protein
VNAALRDLYQETILEHYKRPRHAGRLAEPTHHAEGRNPLCGDHIQVDVKLDGERISEIAHESQGCAICTASASLMTESVLGKTRAEADELVDEFQAIATGKKEPRDEFDDLAALAGVRDHPVRIKCATLPWHALRAALRQEAGATTE